MDTTNTVNRLALALLLTGALAVALPACKRPAAPGGDTAPAPLGAPAPAAADWFMYRGNPALTGVAPGALKLPLTLLWTAKTGGPIASSPAVVGERVFIGANDGKLYALARDSGRGLWTFAAGDAIEAAPLVLDGVVYVGSADNQFYALDAAKGELRWRFATGDKVLGAANFFRAADGALRLLVPSYDGKLYCLDAAGKSVWVSATDNYINGAAAVAGGRAVFGGCDAKLRAVDLTNGAEQAALDLESYIAASPALDGTLAYVGHYGNAVVAADVAAGTVRWTYKERQFPYMSSPALTADLVLIGGRDKRLHALRRSDGSTAWEFRARGQVDGSPVVCGAHVVVGSEDGTLYVVQLADGQLAWSYELGAAITGSVAIVAGRVYLGAADGGVYAFGPQ